ncbi:MAG: hypothetical protein IKH44_02045 [Bacteroidales bacterium]|nr:hypothetical protein [Bacteroidales bacterium]
MNIRDFYEAVIELFPSYVWDIIVNDEVLKVKHKELKKEFFVTNQELNEIYDGLQKNKSGNSFELFNDNYYEAILIVDSNRYIREREEGLVIEDTINRINYKYDKISKELALSILINSDSYMKKNLISKLPLYVSYRRTEDVKSTNILDLITELALRYYSLKITTSSTTSLERFKSYALSYTYTFMYNRQVPMHLYSDVQTSSRLSIKNTRDMDFDSPKKLYNPELVSYYNEAISSTILPHKYLSFYHILEYFYERIFSEDQIIKAREIITDVSFSYKRDKDIAKLIKGIQQKIVDNDITVNEKNALSLLIQKHINQNDLKAKLIERYGDNYLSLLIKNVSFSDGNAIIFSNDESQFIKSLTNRIYKTRNSIVHSKESFVEEKKNNKYKRIKDDKELLQEIALIQVLAEIMINEDSKPI